ncbi:MAG TPA: RDD family protein [Streptosporangiaceae bacterium]
MTQQDDAGAESAAGGAPQPDSGGSVTAAAPAGPAGPATPPSSPGIPVQSGQRPAAPASDASQPAQPPQVSYPSPYLEPGETIPHAYLAPPQPDQPRYGQQPATGYPFAPGRQQGSQPGSARPRYGQPGYGQPGNGELRREPGRPGMAGRGYVPRTRTKREPGLAAAWERLVASIIDWILISAVALVAFAAPLLRIWRRMQSLTVQYPNLDSSAAQRAVDNFLREPANLSTMLHVFLTLFGVALVYYWVLEATWGATLGKRALGMRVVTATDRSPIGVRAAGIRTITFLVGPFLFMLLGSPLNIVAGILWFADTGTPLIDQRVQCLHDKLAGTVVVKRQREKESQPAQPSSPW